MRAAFLLKVIHQISVKCRPLSGSHQGCLTVVIVFAGSCCLDTSAGGLRIGMRLLNRVFQRKPRQKISLWCPQLKRFKRVQTYQSSNTGRLQTTHLLISLCIYIFTDLVSQSHHTRGGLGSDRTHKMVSSSSACSQAQQSQSGTWVSIAIYEPQDGSDIHDAVTHMARVASLLEKRNSIKVAILKSLEQSWAAVFSVWKGGSSADGPALYLPEAAAFTKGITCAVRVVDSGWFRLSSREISRGVSFAQLSLGDIVSLRRLYTASWKRQDVLSYCCLAILKSYFAGLKGILSYSFYDSMDGRQIIGLGVWDSIESAAILANNDDRNANPWVAFWKSLGAKKLQYHVCQVVYVTYQTPCIEYSRPSFQI